MGTHHTLINGTAYAIKGGTDLIAGTKYQIGGAKLSLVEPGMISRSAPCAKLRFQGLVVRM